MKKEKLTAQATKNEFVKSIHKWLMNTLSAHGNEQYQDCFKIEGSSIICTLPENYFYDFEIPAGTKIEMKFIAKKS